MMMVMMMMMMIGIVGCRETVASISFNSKLSSTEKDSATDRSTGSRSIRDEEPKERKPVSFCGAFKAFHYS